MDLAFLGYSFKKRVVTSALTTVKHGQRSGAIYFCMNPRITVYANLIFLPFFAAAPAWLKHIWVMVVFPMYMK